MLTPSVKIAFYQLRHLATIRRFLSYQHFEILIHTFVTSRLDYCNSLLSGLPQNLLQKLQFVQNSAARLLSFTRKTEHITPILKELHWLPVAVRTEFKILVLVFRAYVGVVSEENHGTRFKQTFQVFILTASAGWLRDFTLSAKTHLQRSLQNPTTSYLFDPLQGLDYKAMHEYPNCVT